MAVRFLKGVVHLFPPVKEMVPLWELNAVRAALVGPPHEPLATCSLSFLFQKTAFFIAMTSTRRASEQQALMAGLL